MINDNNDDYPTNKKKNTNRKCCGIFVFCIILSLIIDIYCIINGNYELIFSAIDGDGNMCGHQEFFEEYPLIYYTSLDEQDKRNIYKKAICVNICPRREFGRLNLNKNDQNLTILDPG
jgi:hypothetical protein